MKKLCSASSPVFIIILFLQSEKERKVRLGKESLGKNEAKRTHCFNNNFQRGGGDVEHAAAARPKTVCSADIAWT